MRALKLLTLRTADVLAFGLFVGLLAAAITSSVAAGFVVGGIAASWAVGQMV